MKMAVPVFINQKWLATSPLAAFKFYLFLTHKEARQLSFEQFMKRRRIKAKEVIFAPKELRPVVEMEKIEKKYIFDKMN